MLWIGKQLFHGYANMILNVRMFSLMLKFMLTVPSLACLSKVGNLCQALM